MKNQVKGDIVNVDGVARVITDSEYDTILQQVSEIVERAKDCAIRTVNVMLTLRNWKIGERIEKVVLEGNSRAAYGETIISRLAEDLTFNYGKGFDKVSLYNYLKFYRLFPSIVDAPSQQIEKVDALSQQLIHSSGRLLPWTLYRELIRVEDTAARNWYAEQARIEMWSSRTLHRNIGSQYYYRHIQSPHSHSVEGEKNPSPLSVKDKLEFIKNPVVAEFLGLQSGFEFTENKLESSIIGHLQNFILEMGRGFAFVARQQHIRTDMGDFYIDLVFYNYILKCFFLIDLKAKQISHQDVGQMDMYVRMYDELKRLDGDNPTIGLLLCSDTSTDMAKYSVLHGNEQIFQAKYLTYLPNEEQLRREIEQQKEIYMLQQAKL